MGEERSKIIEESKGQFHQMDEEKRSKRIEDRKGHIPLDG
jgi:hypothetical protein